MCHLLLPKMLDGNNQHKMSTAINCLQYYKSKFRQSYSSRLYQYHRKQYVTARKLRSSNSKWMYHPELLIDSFVHVSNIETRLEEGYMFGRLPGKMKGKFQNRISPTLGLKRPDLIQRNKQPKFWITNGHIDRLIIQDTLSHFEKEGFRRGRTHY